MFGRNNEFKNNYQNTLKQINELSANIRNDDDKIRSLEEYGEGCRKTRPYEK